MRERGREGERGRKRRKNYREAIDPGPPPGWTPRDINSQGEAVAQAQPNENELPPHAHMNHPKQSPNDHQSFLITRNPGRSAGYRRLGTAKYPEEARTFFVNEVRLKFAYRKWSFFAGLFRFFEVLLIFVFAVKLKFVCFFHWNQVFWSFCFVGGVFIEVFSWGFFAGDFFVKNRRKNCIF